MIRAKNIFHQPKFDLDESTAAQPKKRGRSKKFIDGSAIVQPKKRGRSKKSPIDRILPFIVAASASENTDTKVVVNSVDSLANINDEEDAVSDYCVDKPRRSTRSVITPERLDNYYWEGGKSHEKGQS